MELENLRKKLEEDDKNNQSRIDKLRDDIKKRELKDISDNKDLYENQLLSKLEEQIKEEDNNILHNNVLKLLKLFKKIGFLSAFINFSYFLDRFIHDIKHKLNLCREDRKEDKIMKYIVMFLIAIIFGIIIFLLKKILIIILTK